MENTIKLNGVNLDIIKLQLFPFSLRDVAASWFKSMPYGLVDNWEELVEPFMERFFPTIPHLREKKRDYNFQARRRKKPLQCLGEVQETVKEMSNA